MKNGVEMHVLIYVDDLLICGNNNHMLQKFKDYLSCCFSMKDLGKLKYFHGLELSRGPDGFFISQCKYTLDIVSKTGNLGCKPAITPLEQGHQLDNPKLQSPLLAYPKLYRRLVRRLIYLSHTRSELSYAIHILTQFMHTPKEAHWEAALRVVRFIQGSIGQGILLKSDFDLSITVYCDADWSGCPRTRRSLSTYVVLLGGSPISWRTKKKDTVSHSSAEAEYIAMSDALKEIKWLRRLLKDWVLNNMCHHVSFVIVKL